MKFKSIDQSSGAEMLYENCDINVVSVKDNIALYQVTSGGLVVGDGKVSVKSEDHRKEVMLKVLIAN